MRREDLHDADMAFGRRPDGRWDVIKNRYGRAGIVVDDRGRENMIKRFAHLKPRVLLVDGKDS